MIGDFVPSSAWPICNSIGLVSKKGTPGLNDVMINRFGRYGIHTVVIRLQPQAFVCSDHFSPGRSIFRRQKLDRGSTFYPGPIIA